MQYLVWVETLDTAIGKIDRADAPVGWIRGLVQEGVVERARAQFNLTQLQRPHLEYDGTAIARVRRILETAQKARKPKTFKEAYREMAARRNQRKREYKRGLRQRDKANKSEE